jgi:hypothetical protein
LSRPVFGALMSFSSWVGRIRRRGPP